MVWDNHETIIAILPRLPPLRAKPLRRLARCALTAVTGFVTGHETLAGRLIRPSAFDVRGCKSILDAGCGNGRYSRFLLRHADADARLTAFDLSQQMLKRAGSA